MPIETNTILFIINTLSVKRYELKEKVCSFTVLMNIVHFFYYICLLNWNFFFTVYNVNLMIRLKRRNVWYLTNTILFNTRELCSFIHIRLIFIINPLTCMKDKFIIYLLKMIYCSLQNNFNFIYNSPKTN